MNLPNKITVFRASMVPVFLVFMLMPGISGGNYIAASIFAIASASDFLDGYLARKNNLVTDFGKFMDPLADKLLVCSAMICLTAMGRLPAWIVIIVISREFVISGFRLIASDNGKVIAASWWGKFKTTFQMVMVILMIANIPVLSLVTDIIMWIALILTVVSLIDYLVKNKEVMQGTK